MQKNDEIKIFACNANRNLASGIASDLGVNLGLSEALRFSDGEINIRINETVRNADVFIIQSTEPPVNENLMEILIMTDAMRRASAKTSSYFAFPRVPRPMCGRILSLPLSCGLRGI